MNLPYSVYNVYIVGLGGQGVLTVGELIAEAAQRDGLSVNYFPTKGMSQRGGFVNAQIRIGSAAGPALPPRGADLVVAFERSEALKAIRYCNPESSRFVLFDDCWKTSQVITGKLSYPEEELVLREIKDNCRSLLRIPVDSLPVIDGTRGHSNVFMMGVLMRNTDLRRVISPESVEACIASMKNAAFNRRVYQAGLDTAAEG